MDSLKSELYDDMICIFSMFDIHEDIAVGSQDICAGFSPLQKDIYLRFSPLQTVCKQCDVLFKSPWMGGNVTV